MCQTNITPETIGEHLANRAKEANVELLFACESGSRAWGFHSPDSDFDVRFIFRHPRDWYLRLESLSDTLEWFALDNELDFSGWDLKKTLKLFATCNVSLNEHLQSPIYYHNRPNFVESLRELIPSYFMPVKAMRHYFAMAQKQWDKYQSEGVISGKRFFYIMRPLLACEWIDATASMPPTEFVKMLDLTVVSRPFKDALLEMIEQKRTANERALVTPSPFLLSRAESLLTTRSENIETIAARFPKREHPALSELNSLFLRWLENEE